MWGGVRASRSLSSPKALACSSTGQSPVGLNGLLGAWLGACGVILIYEKKKKSNSRKKIDKKMEKKDKQIQDLRAQAAAPSCATPRAPRNSAAAPPCRPSTTSAIIRL